MCVAVVCTVSGRAQPSPAATASAKEAAAATSLNFVALTDPVALAWPKDAPTPKKPLMPLLTDWEGDQQPDLLVSDGDGKLWLVRLAADHAVALKSAEAVKAGGKEISLGKVFQPNYVDMDGDGIPDLIAARDRHVLVFHNSGTREKPEFDDWTFAGSYKSPVLLPEDAGPRLEVADWDRNGLPDLVAGTWSGAVVVFLNHGTRKLAMYETALHVTVENKPLKKAYICSVRFLDVTGDGAADLVLGINYSYISVYENRTRLSMPMLRKEAKVLGSDGGPFEARKLTDIKHIFPAIGDVDGDRVADVVFGNESEKLFFAKGIKR